MSNQYFEPPTKSRFWCWSPSTLCIRRDLAIANKSLDELNLINNINMNTKKRSLLGQKLYHSCQYLSVTPRGMYTHLPRKHAVTRISTLANFYFMERKQYAIPKIMHPFLFSLVYSKFEYCAVIYLSLSLSSYLLLHFFV